MLKAFLERRRQVKAVRNWLASPLGKDLAKHTAHYFTEIPRLAGLREETKRIFVADLYRAATDVAAAESPVLALRERIANVVVAFSELQVLCLTELEKVEAAYANCPYISGSLHHVIDQAAVHTKKLEEIVAGNPSTTKEQLVSFCSTQCLVYLYHLNGLNRVRREYNDHDEPKDWLQPFIESMLIWQEDVIRQKIGQPSLLPNSLEALQYSTLPGKVMSGVRNPYLEWERSCVE